MAVAFLNTNTFGHVTASPVSAAMSVTNSGVNRCAFAIIAYNSAAGMSVSGVTYGGQAMTQAGTPSHNTGNQTYAEVWYLVNPPTGSNTLAFTVAGTVTDIYYNLVAFTGVNQTSPIRAATYQSPSTTVTNGSSQVSLIVSSNTNDLTFTGLNGGALVINSTTQTSDGISTLGSDGAGVDHATTAATSVTHTWTLTGGAGSSVAIVGFSINGDIGPSALTLYASNPLQGGSNAGLLTSVAPAASTSTTGWTVGTTLATQYSRSTYNTEVPTTNFTATAQPSGSPVNLGEDCFRVSAQTSGVFSAGTWYSTVSVIAVTSGGIQDGQAQFRYWRSLNPDGTAATEITQGIMVGSRITELSTTVAQSSSASTQVSTQTFNNEYLFLQLGWETL